MKQCNLGKKQNISKINFCKAPIGMLLQIKKYDYPQKYPLKNNRVRLLCATPRLNLKMLQYIDI